jgi:hypothetical protein
MTHRIGLNTGISLPVSTTPGSMARNNTMSKPKTFSYCMTLRLTAPMESELEDLAYDRHLSKAGTIRRILARAIADAHECELADQYRQFQGGAL